MNSLFKDKYGNFPVSKTFDWTIITFQKWLPLRIATSHKNKQKVHISRKRETSKFGVSYGSFLV